MAVVMEPVLVPLYKVETYTDLVGPDVKVVDMQPGDMAFTLDDGLMWYWNGKPGTGFNLSGWLIFTTRT